MSYSLLWEIQYLPRHRELVSLTDGQWAVMMKDGEMGDLKSTCRAQKCVDLSPVAVGECISDLGRQISQIAQMSFFTLHYHYFHLCLQIQSSGKTKRGFLGFYLFIVFFQTCFLLFPCIVVAAACRVVGEGDLEFGFSVTKNRIFCHFGVNLIFGRSHLISTNIKFDHSSG